jgi:hypothetical protein
VQLEPTRDLQPLVAAGAVSLATRGGLLLGHRLRSLGCHATSLHAWRAATVYHASGTVG